MHDVTGSEVLARVLVECFVEPPDQFLEDRPHRRVVGVVWVEIDVPESLKHLEQETGLGEPTDAVVEVELLSDLAHVPAEPADVVPQVHSSVRRIGDQLVEVVFGGVVEGKPRGLAQQPVTIGKLVLVLRIDTKHFRLSSAQGHNPSSVEP